MTATAEENSVKAKQRIKAKIFACPDKCMLKVEFLKVRYASGLTQEQVSQGMEKKGHSYYRKKIQRFEDAGTPEEYFCLPPREMQDLLDVMGASSL